jgi:Protein of unknown function (DUF3037)
MHRMEVVLLRYVPNVLKDEHVNIGVVLAEPGGGGFRDARFTSDWRNVRALDQDADLDVLQALAVEIREKLLKASNWEELLRSMEESFSNVIQLSERKACEAEDPAAEMEKLASMYLS